MDTLTRGTWLTALSYTLWGTLPLYWRALHAVAPEVVLAHRIAWALAFTSVLVLVLKLGTEVKSLFADRRKTLRMVGAALLISVNWWLYIWAINNGHLLESALGYYINPLVSVALGIVVFRERLTLAQGLAFGLAGVGVLVMAIGVGQFPVVALGLALSFGFYGLLKKQAPVSALSSLQVETLFSLPLAAALMFWFGGDHPWGPEPVSPWTVVLLVLAGPVTAIPLWLFGAGARKIPLVRIGFLQYISPTINLILGLWVFQEPLAPGQAFAFGCVFLALAVFSFDTLRRRGTK